VIGERSVGGERRQAGAPGSGGLPPRVFQQLLVQELLGRADPGVEVVEDRPRHTRTQARALELEDHQGVDQELVEVVAPAPEPDRAHGPQAPLERPPAARVDRVPPRTPASQVVTRHQRRLLEGDRVVGLHVLGRSHQSPQSRVDQPGVAAAQPALEQRVAHRRGAVPVARRGPERIHVVREAVVGALEAGPGRGDAVRE
jgi:hypothetical protein